MHTPISMIRVVFLAAALTALAACGKGNSDAPTVDSNGKHPAGWVGQHGTVAASSTSSCTQCHGDDLAGGIAKVSCMSASNSGFRCHVTSPAVNPTGCISCHGVPPNGATAPNRANAHAKHLALSGMTCASCHGGAGFGTANHARATATGGIAGATVLLSDTLTAKTVTTTFGYDAASGVCSAVSCHGGQTTPIWSSGSVNVATDCLRCHEQGTAAQTPQYNSFFSGTDTVINLHKLHLLLRLPNTATPIFCTDCHSATALTSHFSGLTTPAFEASAASTIGGIGTKITTYTPYTAAVPSGSCTSTCHALNSNNPRNWIN